MYACPMCRQSLTVNAGACDWCAVKLAPDEKGAPKVVLPSVNPGKVIVGRDFGYASLPSLTSRDHKWDDGDHVDAQHDGLVLNVKDGMRWFTEPVLRMRDGVVRVLFDVLDSDVRVRVVARKQVIGAYSLWYEMSIYPDKRSYRLSRHFSSKEHGDDTELCSGENHPLVRGLGGFNYMELRVQGPTLEGWLNGTKVCATHDASLGIGSTAIAAGTSEKSNRRVLFRSFEVTEVAP